MHGAYLKTKKVYIFVNGREDYKSFYIHPRSRMGWNAILAIFSTALRPTFGAIRILRTRDGRKVIDNFEDLKHGGKYVACGLETFKSLRGGYRTDSELEVKMKSTEYYPTETLSAEDQKKYPCLVETMRKGRTIIYVFANGKKSTPRKVVLTKSDYKMWDNMLKHIGNILDIPEGVKGLCTAFGQPLCSPYEIQHGGYYVAIPFNATFKKMKYLPTKKTESYPESSPMITKEAYVSASKTCNSIEDLSGKRRRGKSTRARERSGEKGVQPITSLKSETYAGEGMEARFREKGSKDHVEEDNTSTEEWNQQDSDDDIMQDIDITEEQIQTAEYEQNEIFTQTSAICFESTSEQENAIIMNEKKFFLITEEELKQLKSTKADKRFSDLTLQSSDLTYENLKSTDRLKREEVSDIAGKFVGIITKLSEKMVSKSLFGEDYISEGSSDVNSRSFTGKVSFIPDTVQLQRDNSPENHEGKIAKSAISKKAKPQSDFGLKYLRLSLPIGRGNGNLTDDDLEPELFPTTKGGLHSPPVELSDSIMNEIDEDSKPFTTADYRNIGRKHSSDVTKNDFNGNIPNKIPFYGLRRDSMGIPLITKLYGLRKESIDEDEIEAKEVEALHGEHRQEDEAFADDESVSEEYESNDLDNIEDTNVDSAKVESPMNVRQEEEKPTEYVENRQEDGEIADEEIGSEEDEWNKLDILDDMQVEYDKVESPMNVAEEEEMPTEGAKDENGTDSTDESKSQNEQTENNEEKDVVQEIAIEKVITSVNLERSEPKTENTIDNISEYSQISNAEIKNMKMSADISSQHSAISNANLEDTKMNANIISDHSQLSNVDDESTISSDESSEESQSSMEEAEEIEINREINIDRPESLITADTNTEIMKDAEVVTSEYEIETSEDDEIGEIYSENKGDSAKNNEEHYMKIDSVESITSIKGSSSQFYAQKDMQAPETLYGSLLNTSKVIEQSDDDSFHRDLSSELPVLTQRTKVGSYCVTLNSWISMKVEECDDKLEENMVSQAGQIDNSKSIAKPKKDQQKSVKNEFEEERRRSLLNFMKMRIEVALSNKIPELRQPDKTMK